MIGVGESTITVAHVDAMILTLTGSAEGTKCVLAFEAGIWYCDAVTVEDHCCDVNLSFRALF